MKSAKFVVVTDRGGHLHNALMLMDQLPEKPHAIVTTQGPDIDSLAQGEITVFSLPHLFKWFGKLRVLNPFNVVWHFLKAFHLAWKLRPTKVISLGASNVVSFCFWAKVMGAKIYHVECMNQVVNPSITAKLLYPICEEVYVQWSELLPRFGSKAKYAGWVL
ncbi:MAG: hypothetical protein EBR01_02040 [Proteobacteria bacterium]|nr:hypothetical protein [Pseudomonadota bacterium]NBY20501.1 hypothetical protein [bacterium]